MHLEKNNVKTDHVSCPTAKANWVLGMFKKNFVSRDSEIWKKFYVSLVFIFQNFRPHLEYAVQVWCPYLVMDMRRYKRFKNSSGVVWTRLQGKN